MKKKSLFKRVSGVLTGVWGLKRSDKIEIG